jgi:hypothetical protein
MSVRRLALMIIGCAVSSYRDAEYNAQSRGGHGSDGLARSRFRFDRADFASSLRRLLATVWLDAAS